MKARAWPLVVVLVAGCGARTISSLLPEPDASIDAARDATGDTSAVDTGPRDTGVPDTTVVDTGMLDTGMLDTGTLDTGPEVFDTGTPVDTCVPVEAGPPPAPFVKTVSGGCNISSSVLKRCDRKAKCPAPDCVSDCDSCACDAAGTLRCTDSVCDAPGALCPSRIPAAWSACVGDCVCEYDSACAGKPHRAACVAGRFRVSYAACAAACPKVPAAAGTPCFTEGLVCPVRPDTCTEVSATCDRGFWAKATWTSASTWGCAGCPAACPKTAPPRTGDACTGDFVPGQRCAYTSDTGEYQYCACLAGRFACWTGIARAIPGLEAAPSGRCSVSPWCPKVGECCTVGFPKEGCTCTTDGMQCGPGNGC